MGAKKLFLVDDDVIFKIAAEVLIKTHKLADEVVQLANGLEAYNALISLEHSPNDLPDVHAFGHQYAGYERLGTLGRTKTRTGNH